ncbi:two-component sensor histidine kinase [Actinoplanes sp. ATCC 53533]|uniref:sensor histidine kinase n=1 Tax=Actinoplanes sp. ATCC 53533 TaxID=1288362 RepID=UPI000F79513D|nr:histidine kinase [Actinoplanes sp. ATCC 53533]RSM74174.1 two-component sensor histidine kinase [Actinoplanes sp. ATCC 53533]
MGSARVGVRDWLVAVGVAAILVVTGLSGHRWSSGTDQLGYALLAAGGLALAARRRAPVAVLVVSGLCAVGYQAAGFTVFAVAYLVAVYSAMRAGHRVATAAVSVVLLAALPVAVMASGRQDAGAAFTQARSVLELAWLIAAGAAGEALRQAERRADEAERTREQSALRRADEERLHIARELHDSLTHQISVIKVQAEAAVHVAQKRGEPVPDALLAIRDAGREAARELRATLEALRDDDRTPPRGLDHLADLVQRAGTTGLRASLTIEGHRADVPAAVDRTAYRIVQESLTNVARHARAGTASVRVAYRPGAVVIQVDDDGTATPQSPPVPGVGLLGMRERVTALGGKLRAEPRGEGGFTVHAELPVDRAS